MALRRGALALFACASIVAVICFTPRVSDSTPSVLKGRAQVSVATTVATSDEAVSGGEEPRSFSASLTKKPPREHVWQQKWYRDYMDKTIPSARMGVMAGAAAVPRGGENCSRSGQRALFWLTAGHLPDRSSPYNFAVFIRALVSRRQLAFRAESPSQFCARGIQPADASSLPGGAQGPANPISSIRTSRAAPQWGSMT
jgi:hypothetical protein